MNFNGTSETLYAQKTYLVPEKRQIGKPEAEKLKSWNEMLICWKAEKLKSWTAEMLNSWNAEKLKSWEGEKLKSLWGREKHQRRKTKKLKAEKIIWETKR